MSGEEGKGITVNITLAEIDEILCEKCRKKLRELVRSKLPDDLIENIISRRGR
ncbi:MAG: hypothetical protein QXT14_08810 [Candidatus Bathyarchaeia archaeon]